MPATTSSAHEHFTELSYCMANELYSRSMFIPLGSMQIISHFICGVSQPVQFLVHSLSLSLSIVHSVYLSASLIMTKAASQRMSLTMHFLHFVPLQTKRLLFFSKHLLQHERKKERKRSGKKIQLNEYELINIPFDSLQKYFT